MLAASLQVTPCKYVERLSAKRAFAQVFMYYFCFYREVPVIVCSDYREP